MVTVHQSCMRLFLRAHNVTSSRRGCWLRRCVATMTSAVDELSKRCYWGKQLVAVGCGLSCGVTAVTGAPAFMLFGSLTVLLLAAVMRSPDVASLPQERRWEVAQEGLMPAFGSFLLTWTLSFSTVSQ